MLASLAAGAVPVGIAVIAPSARTASVTGAANVSATPGAGAQDVDQASHGLVVYGLGCVAPVAVVVLGF